VEIDLSLVSIDWYFGTEAEGFTLKIETTDLSKAREILLLRERVNFDMGVGEMTASQQSHLRLIATTPKSGMTANQSRHTKPILRKILSESQIAEIKKNGPHPPGNPPQNTLEKTILGKDVPASTPKPPDGETKDEWTGVGKGKKNKKGFSAPPSSSVQPGKVSAANAFEILEDQEEDEVVDDTQEEKKHEKEEKEGKEADAPEGKSQKQIEALAELKEKNATKKKFKSMRRLLSKMQLWGRQETSTMVEAYIAVITGLGYDIANDTLENLLRLEKENIREEVEQVISGKGRASLQDAPKEDTSSLPGVPVPDVETPVSNDDEKKSDAAEDTQDQALNIVSNNTETQAASEGGEQSKEQASMPTPLTESRSSGSLDMRDIHPPDPGLVDPTEMLNLSSAEKPQTTILDFFAVLPSH
jgi:hypothetical protein